LKDRSLAVLNECMDHINGVQDLSRTLDPAMLEHARRLAAAHDDEQPDTEVLGLLGRLHMFRFLALDGESPGEMEIAVWAFARCLIYGDEPLPQRFVPHVLDDAMDLATGLLQRAAESDDPFLTDQAVDAWRRIEAVISAGHPDRALILNNLGVALEMRYDLAGASADREEAIAVREQAAQAAEDIRESDL
jgi:hypothetical protein